MFLIMIQRVKEGGERLFCIIQNLKYGQSHKHK